MQTWKITRAQDRLRLARERLRDHINPVDRIVVPAGMRSWQFERLTAKVLRLEAYIAKQIIRGLNPATKPGPKINRSNRK